jgi:peptidoglycan hydrolase-like amidase
LNAINKKRRGNEMSKEEELQQRIKKVIYNLSADITTYKTAIYRIRSNRMIDKEEKAKEIKEIETDIKYNEHLIDMLMGLK